MEENLEVEAVNLTVGQPFADMIQASIAVSLKRIADALEVISYGNNVFNGILERR